MRVGVDQVADLPDVPLGHEPAVVQQDDPRRDDLDLVEHVARDDDAPALVAQAMDDVHQVAAGDRVGAGERLVEEEDERVVDEGLRELGALAHPLGVAADGPVGVLGHADDVERPGRGLARRRGGGGRRGGRRR